MSRYDREMLRIKKRKAEIEELKIAAGTFVFCSQFALLCLALTIIL